MRQFRPHVTQPRASEQKIERCQNVYDVEGGPENYGTDLQINNLFSLRRPDRIVVVPIREKTTGSSDLCIKGRQSKRQMLRFGVDEDRRDSAISYIDRQR